MLPALAPSTRAPARPDSPGAGATKAGAKCGGGGGSASAAKVVDTVAISSSDRDLIRGLMDMDDEPATEAARAEAPPTPADGSKAQEKHRQQTVK